MTVVYVEENSKVAGVEQFIEVCEGKEKFKETTDLAMQKVKQVEFKPAEKKHKNKGTKESNDNHKAFEEATKLTGMSREGLKNKLEEFVQNNEV